MRLVPLVGISLACAVDISTDDFAFIRDIGISTKARGANKYVYRQILNKK